MSDTTARQPVVSAIICTRDRADDLARCLPTVLANDYPDFEVIVVDQSSTDATQRVVEALAKTTGWRAVVSLMAPLVSNRWQHTSSNYSPVEKAF